jgi:Uracil DNA glycosylase superfamily
VPVSEYMRSTTDAQREALARRIARLRLDGVPWDGPGGIVDALHLVSSATQGRALLRKYKFDAASGGPVEILASYDRSEINPTTGVQRGYRSKHGARQIPKQERSARPTAVAVPEASSVTDQGTPRVGHKRGDSRHAAIEKLVRRIRRETRAAVPDVDPRGPGIDAEVLIILRDPGRFGALTTNYLSVMNPDRTAANQRRLLAAANLPLDVCLFWNAVPWDMDGRNPGSADLEAGGRYLIELVDRMARPPIIVACGNAAQDVCARARLDAIQICHPSDRGLHGGGVNREPAHVDGLKEAARRVRVRART